MTKSVVIYASQGLDFADLSSMTGVTCTLGRGSHELDAVDVGDVDRSEAGRAERIDAFVAILIALTAYKEIYSIRAGNNVNAPSVGMGTIPEAQCTRPHYAWSGCP